jgi:hypothetical protein
MTAPGRLIRAAAEVGASVLWGKELPAEQVERRRQAALRLNLGRNLVKNYHGPRWTKAQLRMLGRLPDEEVGRRTGRSWNAVRGKRESLVIPNPAAGPADYGREPWTAEEDDLMRSPPPAEAAARTGRTLMAVYCRRGLLGLTGCSLPGRRTIGRQKD